MSNPFPQTLTFVPATLTRQIGLQASHDEDLQARFANGLLWCYGFHHEEAQRHFRGLLAQDNTNPFALWGLAYASAPFYNRPWSWFTDNQKKTVAKLGYSCLKKAQQHSRAISNDANPPIAHVQSCCDLVDALSLLFRTPVPVSDEVFLTYQQEYADHMQALVARYAEHADITTLACEALLNCTPWQLWDTDSRSQASGSRVHEALALLEPLLNDDHPAHAHPGLLHLHIHALEMSPTPEAAAGSAEKLRQLVMSAQLQNQPTPTHDTYSQLPPHLPHMASHIDVLQGKYRHTININRIAADTDLQISSEDGEFYQISRLHNVHMMLYAAMMAGRQADAIDAANRLQSLATEFYCENSAPLLKVSVEGFFANRLHMFIRFGLWQKIQQEFAHCTDNKSTDNKKADAMQSLPFVQAMQSYTLGVALANSAEHHLAELESENFQRLATRIPDWYIINNNPAGNILSVAWLMLAGEHYYHLGNTEEGLGYLRRAVDACDKLSYCEPRAWMHPPRHALGALLLEQNQLEEALQVYQTDLGLDGLLSRCQQNPNNIWALQGLRECYERLGLGGRIEGIQLALQEAKAYADISISSSCFCRG